MYCWRDVFQCEHVGNVTRWSRAGDSRAPTKYTNNEGSRRDHRAAKTIRVQRRGVKEKPVFLPFLTFFDDCFFLMNLVASCGSSSSSPSPATSAMGSTPPESQTEGILQLFGIKADWINKYSVSLRHINSHLWFHKVTLRAAQCNNSLLQLAKRKRKGLISCHDAK